MVLLQCHHFPHYDVFNKINSYSLSPEKLHNKISNSLKTNKKVGKGNGQREDWTTIMKRYILRQMQKFEFEIGLR